MSLKSYLFCAVIIFSSFSFFLFEVHLLNAQTTQDGTQVHLIVENCNHNNICEPTLGENFQGCASDCIPPPPPDSTSTNNGSGVHTSSIGSEIFPTAIPSANDALISWSTAQATQGTLRWGVTPDYELGVIAEIRFANDHEIRLSDLQPGTRYYFRIDAVNSSGKNYSGQGEFFTLPAPDTIPPSNVTNIRVDLHTDINGNFISLNWNNPTDPDFQNVRVIKSEDFYSFDPQEGMIVYQGSGNAFSDHDVRNDVDYYYTFFSQDADGNYSSGAVAHVRLSLNSSPEISNSNIPIGQETNIQSNTFNLSDFEVIQQNQIGQAWAHLILHDDTIVGLTGRPIIMIISKDKLPTDARYLLISVQDPGDPSFFDSYLIRSINDKNSLEVDIPAFEKAGKYTFFVTVLDDDKQVISQSHGVFDIQLPHLVVSFAWAKHFSMWISQIINLLKAFWQLLFWYIL